MRVHGLNKCPPTLFAARLDAQRVRMHQYKLSCFCAHVQLTDRILIVSPGLTYYTVVAGGC